MCAQHGRQRKGRSARLALGIVGGNQLDQGSPGHHLIHLAQEDLLAGFLHAEIEVQADLFHGLYFLSWGLHQAHNWGSFAEFS